MAGQAKRSSATWSEVRRSCERDPDEGGLKGERVEEGRAGDPGRAGRNDIDTGRGRVCHDRTGTRVTTICCRAGDPLAPLAGQDGFPDRKNGDGQWHSGGRAVAHHAGGVPITDPTVTSKAPDGRFYRLGINGWEPTIGVDDKGRIFYQARNADLEPHVMRSTNEGHTWEIVSPTIAGAPAQPLSLDPILYLDKDTDRVFTNNIPPDADVSADLVHRRRRRVLDEHRDLRTLRPPEHLHRTRHRGRRSADRLPERRLLLRDQPRHAVGHVDRNDLWPLARRRHDVAPDRRAGVHHADPAARAIRRSRGATARSATGSSVTTGPSISRGCGAGSRSSRSARTRASRGIRSR